MKKQRKKREEKNGVGVKKKKKNWRENQACDLKKKGRKKEN